jgi:hypothetical protein
VPADPTLTQIHISRIFVVPSYVDFSTKHMIKLTSIPVEPKRNYRSLPHYTLQSSTTFAWLLSRSHSLKTKMPSTMQRSSFRSTVLERENSSRDMHKAFEKSPQPKYEERRFANEHPPPPPPSPVSWKYDKKRQH